MKNTISLCIILLFSLNLSSQEIAFNSPSKYDCSHKKWAAFSKDTVIIVKPTRLSYSIDALLNDFYGFLNHKYIEKTESELSKNDLKKSLLIIGKASDFKKWKAFNLPINKKKKGFVFNNIKFFKKQDAFWLNDYKRLVITANSLSVLKTMLDIGQLGIDFFALQNNQLTYFGNFISSNYNKIKWYNIQDLKKSNFTLYKGNYANFYISKKIKDRIDIEKINNDLKKHINKYASFFKISIPKNKVNVLVHFDQKEMSNMMGMWSLSCGGSSEGMNIRGEIHCIGSSQGLINHEISHHIFNSNIPAEKLPPLLLEGVVEVFTNYKNPNLYRTRINNTYENWTKFNFKELLEKGNSFYNSNSLLNYELAGIWVEYFIEIYGLKTFKLLCLSDNKITFIESLTKNSFQHFLQNFKLWLDDQKNINSKLKIEFNQNISTYSIVERIVADYKGRLFYIDGKRDYDYIPMVSKAFKKYGINDNTKIIESTLNYLSVVGNQQDLTYQALLRYNKFPNMGFKYSLDDLKLNENQLSAIKKYVEDLRGFFIENNLADFFTDNFEFINGGIQEFSKNVPSKYFEKMEAYYGEEFLGCRIYPDAFNTVPIEEGEKDFFHGHGPKIKTVNGNLANIISSAFIPLKKKIKDEYGFNHPNHVKRIITHEFGHSFVNHALEKLTSQLSATEKLFNSELSKKMKPQGYQNWFTCMAEHLVRLGEIRIAEINGEKERAEELRKMHIKEFSFVLIPVLENKIIEYEQNRDRYLNYQDFLPELLSVLNKITPEKIREFLNHSATISKTKTIKENQKNE